jgi:hypothetical protein
MKVDLAQVKEVAQAAMAAGQSPHDAIKESFDISSATADRYLFALRTYGDLPYLRPHRDRMEQVADALGIDPAVLREAITTHAGGYLRVWTRRPKG